MKKQAVEKELLQWHQAFYAGLQIELEKEADKLIFENEHQLGTKPMGIDVLIIKKDTEEPIHKNIGRIFRKHNVIEYKSPEDYLSIDDFYKVYGYCCFYKADVTNVDCIKVDELTISFVCSRHPRKLIKHLKRVRGYSVELIENGIYQVMGDMFPIQIIVTTQLSKEENLWLKSLTDRLKRADIVEGLMDSYKENYKNPLYKSMMNIIIRANQEIFEEVRDMCEALEELMKDKIEERAEERAKVIAEKLVEERVKEIAEKRAKELAEERVKEIAENRVNDLNTLLSKQGRIDDIIKAAGDKEYQKKLFEEFDL